MALQFDPASLNAPGGIIHGLGDLGAAVVTAMNRKAERKYAAEERDKAQAQAAAIRAAEQQFQLDRDETAYKRKLAEIESEQKFKSSESEKDRASREKMATARNLTSTRNASLRLNARAGAAGVPKDVIMQAYSAAGVNPDGKHLSVTKDPLGLTPDQKLELPWTPEHHAKFNAYLNNYRAQNRLPPLSPDEQQALQDIGADDDAPAAPGAAPIPTPGAAPVGAAPAPAAGAGGDWKAQALAQLDAKLATVPPDKRPAAEAKAALYRQQIQAAQGPEALQTIQGVRVTTPPQQTIQFTPEQQTRWDQLMVKPTESPAAPGTPLGFTPTPDMNDAQLQLLIAHNERNRARMGQPPVADTSTPDFQRAVEEANTRMDLGAATMSPSAAPMTLLQQIEQARRARAMQPRPFMPPAMQQGIPNPFALQELQ
jgi:hypothetical protein